MPDASLTPGTLRTFGSIRAEKALTSPLCWRTGCLALIDHVGALQRVVEDLVEGLVDRVREDVAVPETRETPISTARMVVAPRALAAPTGS